MIKFNSIFDFFLKKKKSSSSSNIKTNYEELKKTNNSLRSECNINKIKVIDPIHIEVISSGSERFIKSKRSV